MNRQVRSKRDVCGYRKNVGVVGVMTSCFINISFSPSFPGNETFKGFMVQAVDPATGNVIGSFKNTDGMRGLTCGSGHQVRLFAFVVIHYFVKSSQ